MLPHLIMKIYVEVIISVVGLNTVAGYCEPIYKVANNKIVRSITESILSWVN